jgi:hypothetical protein
MTVVCNFLILSCRWDHVMFTSWGDPAQYFGSVLSRLNWLNFVDRCLPATYPSQTLVALGSLWNDYDTLKLLQRVDWD